MTNNLLLSATVLFLIGSSAAAPASAQSVPPVDRSALVRLGDQLAYGSYKVIKIGEGIYQINDPGDPKTLGGGQGVDMYLICGTRKALMIDLGNNYIDGYAKDLIAPRTNAAEELRALVSALSGKLPLEIALTHAHPDHDGMTAAFTNRNVTIWMPDGEDLTGPQTQHKIDPSAYTRSTPGTPFDLGGGRIVDTIRLRGHSNGGTVYLLGREMLLFTGDCLGSGFGQFFGTVERLTQFADDSRSLVDHISSRYSPYERYSLRVYAGHAWQNGFGGPPGKDVERVDVGYLDWRFVQNMASCARGIFAGKWVIEGSGLRYLGGKDQTDRWASQMVFGIGSIAIPLEVAYQAAGLKGPR